MYQERRLYRKLDCGCIYEIFWNLMGGYYKNTLTKFMVCKKCSDKDDTNIKKELLKEIDENDSKWFYPPDNSFTFNYS